MAGFLGQQRSIAESLEISGRRAVLAERGLDVTGVPEAADRRDRPGGRCDSDDELREHPSRLPGKSYVGSDLADPAGQPVDATAMVDPGPSL
jgi:hypothetical protein